MSKLARLATALYIAEGLLVANGGVKAREQLSPSREGVRWLTLPPPPTRDRCRDGVDLDTKLKGWAERHGV